MDIPTPPQAVAALAANVWERLVEVTETIAPLWKSRSDGAEVVTSAGSADSAVLAAARHFATIVVGAAAPFAPTPYSRARLIRQMHASGLLTADEAYRASAALDVDAAARGTVDAEVVSDVESPVDAGTRQRRPGAPR